MAKHKNSPPLAKDPHVKELLAILDAHKSHSAEDLRAMLANVANMEKQLAAAVIEMTAMRRELSTIREERHPLRKVLQNTITVMQGQIDTLREQIDALKAAIIEGCKNAISAFKERGISALDGISRFFKLRPALEKMAVSLEQAEQENTRAVSRIEAISAEYHKAGQHLRNVGRAITGKDPLPDPKPVGKVAKAVEAPFKAARACNVAVWFQVQGALENLSKLEKAADRPAPIKEQFDKAAGEAARHNAARNAPDKAKPIPAHEV